LVSFAQLRDAKPQLWKAAADDLVKIAHEADQAASDIYDRARAPSMTTGRTLSVSGPGSS
jgi:hypothetical protein